MNIQQIRQDTPLHERYAYLDTAAASAPPRQVIKAMTDYLRKTTELGPYLPSFRKETYAQVDAIREKAARYIGAEAKEIAFVKNGTEAINFVANGLNWSEGDEVIIADLEFHSNFVPWLRLEREGKIKLKVLKTDKSGVISPAALEELITPRTRLISVSHLPNASGALQPIEAICEMAKGHGVLTLVNASQSLGMVPIDVTKVKCDFLAACGRKGLRGPEGSGILFIRSEWIESITPTLIGWGGTSWDFDTNDFSFLPIAKRVEAGCPIVPSILGLGAALEYASAIGVEAIYERVRKLTAYAVGQMEKIPGMVIYGPERLEDRLALLPFNVKGLSPDRITQYLEENGIIIESGTFMANTMLQQYGINKMARVSLHYFNTEEEIDKTVQLILDLLQKEGQQ